MSDSGALWSPEVRIMFHPAAAYQELARSGDGGGKWLALRRPLFFSFALACTVSFAATGQLTLRLVFPATIYAGVELLVLVFALWLAQPHATNDPASPTFSQSIDLFFAGFGPWLLWLVAFSAIWSFARFEHASRWTGPRFDGYALAALVLWSAYIDFCFFRYVYRSPPQVAIRRLLTQRAVSWTLSVIMFGGGSIMPELVRTLR